MRRFDSVSLVFSESKGLRTPSTGWMPPLGLLSIATFLKKENPQLSIKVVNCEVEHLKKSVLGADLVGFSTQISNYENSLKLARSAHKKGATVLFGGPYASTLAERIVSARPFVDAVVVGTGEHVVNEIVKGKRFSDVPSIVFARNGRTTKTRALPTDFNKVPFPSREFIDLEHYFKNFVKMFPRSKFKRPTTFFSQRGCFWSKVRGGCIFCARKEEYQFKHPALVWKEVKYLEEEYNVDYLDDESDSYLQNLGFLRQLVVQKPKTSASFRVWARSDHITQKSAELLRRLGVHDVFLGVESGDATCLKNLNKGTTIKDNIIASKILKKHGINTFVYFVLGAPGENKKSLENSLKHAKQLIEIGNLETLGANILLPLPGSTSFEMLSKKIPLQGDYLSPLHLQKEWIKNFTRSSWKEINNYLDRIVDLPAPMKYKRECLE